MAAVEARRAARRVDATPGAAAAPTVTDRVYDAIYGAILEHRLSPGTRLREAELAAGFDVSRTVVRQALQRLAQDRLVDLHHNRGAQVCEPSRELAAQVFDVRRVVECEIARRLGGRLAPAQLADLRALVDEESAADARGDRPAAIRLSGRFHRVLAQMSGNAVFVRIIDELLPTTSLLLALYGPGGPHACSGHRHEILIAALERSGAAAAAGMRRHLLEIERLASARGPASRLPLRDLFAPYREPS